MALQPQAEQYGEVCTFVTRDDPSDAAERCIAMLTEVRAARHLCGRLTPGQHLGGTASEAMFCATAVSDGRSTCWVLYPAQPRFCAGLLAGEASLCGAELPRRAANLLPERLQRSCNGAADACSCGEWMGRGLAARRMHCAAPVGGAPHCARTPCSALTANCGWFLLQASPWVALLRLMPIVPLSRWRALTEYLQSLNAQKQAFGRTHGPFLYLMALGAPPEAAVSGPDDPRVLLLQHLLEVADKEQQMVYIEARPAHRAWYRPYGFREIMAYQPRKSAPSIHIMARSPVPARAQPVSPEVRSPRR